MSVRTRLLLGALLLIVLPLGALTAGLRHRLADRAATGFEQRARQRLDRAVLQAQRLGEDAHRRLDAVAEVARDDDRLRLALVGGRLDLRPYLHDAAWRLRQLSGLDVLQLQNEAGRILSSGHHRQEFGRLEPDLPQLLAGSVWPNAGEPLRAALVMDRTASGEMLTLQTQNTFPLADSVFTLVGGFELKGEKLGGPAADLDLQTAIWTVAGPVSRWPRPETDLAPFFAVGATERELDARLAASGHVGRAVSVPLIRDGRREPAWLVVTVDRRPLDRTLRDLDLTLALALVLALVGAVVLAVWASDRFSRPLRRLTARAEVLDLDQPGPGFETDRGDEVGRLARVLEAMVARLRESAGRLREAERRATLGEVARQVNHDVRNGLTPLRNVLRHLGEVAENEPDRLAEVLAARRGTLETGLAYLEELAANYARLTPERRRERCDLVGLARQAAAAAPPARVRTSGAVPLVLADPVSLRRILDNLLRNAQEALPDGGGDITVELTRATESGEAVLTVNDTGEGIAPEDLDRIWTDFYTSKSAGTGLGLSNVRRLVGDAGGSVTVLSEPGRGTTFTVRLPAAEAES